MTAAPSLSRRAPAGNTATSLLKLIALVFMFTDHAGKMLFANLEGMRVLGRIAFPLYAWCMVVGFHYTRCVWKYCLRVLLVGLVSQPLYMLALNHTWSEPNVFLTLLLGLCALWGIREKKAGSHIWAPVLTICLATLLHADYGWKGVLFLIVLYAVRDSRPAIAAVMVSYFLFWGSSYGLVRSFFGIPLDPGGLPEFLRAPLTPFLRLEAFGLLSLPLVLVRFPRDLRMPRWLGYAIYPLHLILLYALERLTGLL